MEGAFRLFGLQGLALVLIYFRQTWLGEFGGQTRLLSRLAGIGWMSSQLPIAPKLDLGMPRRDCGEEPSEAVILPKRYPTWC